MKIPTFYNSDDLKDLGFVSLIRVIVLIIIRLCLDFSECCSIDCIWIPTSDCNYSLYSFYVKMRVNWSHFQDLYCKFLRILHFITTEIFEKHWKYGDSFSDNRTDQSYVRAESDCFYETIVLTCAFQQILHKKCCIDLQ